jgi:hypothetical protein
LIVKDADVLFAFYTDIDNSRGTSNCVGQAKKKGIPVYEFDAKTDRMSRDGTYLREPYDYAKLLEIHRVIESTARPDSEG